MNVDFEGCSLQETDVDVGFEQKFRILANCVANKTVRNGPRYTAANTVCGIQSIGTRWEEKDIAAVGTSSELTENILTMLCTASTIGAAPTVKGRKHDCRVWNLKTRYKNSWKWGIFLQN